MGGLYKNGLLEATKFLMQRDPDDEDVQNVLSSPGLFVAVGEVGTDAC